MNRRAGDSPVRLHSFSLLACLSACLLSLPFPYDPSSPWQPTRIADEKELHKVVVPVVKSKAQTTAEDFEATGVQQR